MKISMSEFQACAGIITLFILAELIFYNSGNCSIVLS